MKYTKIFPIILSCLLLTACGGETDSQAAKQTPDANVEQPIALGTDINDVVKPTTKAESASSEVEELRWEDLVPENFRPATIIQKYQQAITDAAEGSEEERALYKKIMAEMNSAGANLDLNGKQVRIPGFISPLDTSNGLIGDFLLVPYFGSCIHSPPPPINQTVMVSPGKGKEVALSKASRPVWVVGELEAKEVATDLATAGYQIKNAQIEEYVVPKN